MAISKCIKCGGSRFELQEVEPAGANFKYYFVQCARCGGVVGVVEANNLGAMIHKLGQKLGFTIS